MMVECRDLAVEYRCGGQAVRPVDGLDLEISSGELVVVMGPSGCGKTSLLSMLAGILRPLRGSITVDGLEVTRLAGNQLTDYRRHRVGVVFQAFNLIPSLTAAENVQVPLRVARFGQLRSRNRARDLLEQMGLADRCSHRPGALSGGQQQRVAIARALALDPPLLLADEPTAHLDQGQVGRVARRLREIADDGRVVVVATHDERILPQADRAIVLDGAAHSAAPAEDLPVATTRRCRRVYRRTITAPTASSTRLPARAHRAPSTGAARVSLVSRTMLPSSGV
jgi:putative ABC transport system ATP-binding protein